MNNTSFLDKDKGFGFISGSTYLSKITDLDVSFDEFKNLYSKSLTPDGVRNRSYLKLSWNRQSNQVDRNVVLFTVEPGHTQVQRLLQN